MGSSEHTDMQPPGPDPALKALEMFVGTWQVTGRTIGADEDNVTGTLQFEWLPGGFFLQQRVEFDFAGFRIAALEVIGYDQETGRFPSTVTASGGWRPDPGLKGPGDVAYDIVGRRVG